MAFLDKKEQVLEIQLTQHGKRTLGSGSFKPTYYAFFDENILYDGQYASLSESQNDIQSRIKEAPRTEAQYNFAGIDTNYRNKESAPNYEKHYIRQLSLGNSELGNQRAPAWNLRFLYNTISGSVNYITGSHQNYIIPELSSSIEFLSSINNIDKIPPTDITTKIYPDGTYISVSPDYFLLQIEEENVDFLNENFEIEIYEILSGSNGSEERQLFFSDDERQELTPKLADYYFDILMDDKIDGEILCKVKNELRTRDFITDFSEVLEKCSEEENLKFSRANPYDSRGTVEDNEECE